MELSKKKKKKSQENVGYMTRSPFLPLHLHLAAQSSLI